MVRVPSMKENPQFGIGQFGANAAFDGLLGLRYAWGTTFGFVLPNIDKELARLSKGGGAGGGSAFGPNFNLFGTASLKMLEEIGHGLTHTQQAAAEKYITEAWAFEGIGAVIERVAEDAIQTRKLIRQKSRPIEITRVVRPNIRAQIQPVARRAEQAERRAEAAERKARGLEQRVAVLERQAKAEGIGGVVGLPPRVGLGERDMERIKAGLRKLSKWGTLAFFLALLAKALEKMGASWIRCGNVKRFGRRLCGMDSAALDALLAGSVLIVGALSLRQLTEEVLAVEDQIAAGVKRSIRELRDVSPVTEGGYAGVADGRT